MTLGSDVYAVSMCTVPLPPSNVLFAIFLPQAITLHSAILEISHVVLLPKGKQASSVRLVIHEVAKVGGTGWEAHIALPHPTVETEITLIECVLSDQYTQTMPATALHSSEVDPVLSSNYLVPLLSYQLTQCEVVLAQLVRGRLDLVGKEETGVLWVVLGVIAAERQPMLEGTTHKFIGLSLIATIIPSLIIHPK